MSRLDKMNQHDLQMAMAARMPFEDELHQAVEASGLTIDEIAVRARTSTAVLTRIMAGNLAVTIETACRIAGALGSVIEVRLRRADQCVRLVDVDTAIELDDRFGCVQVKP